VVTLSAPLTIIHQRIDSRAVPTAAEWCRARTDELLALWSDEPLTGETVDVGSRSATDAAAEITRLSGWLP
jgi:hypothetical protein